MMCSYSMIADHYTEKWQHQYPQLQAWPWPAEGVDRIEFENLKREVADLKELLKKAKEYDTRNDEPDCEMADKVALLRKVAELVGVDFKEALPVKGDG